MRFHAQSAPGKHNPSIVNKLLIANRGEIAIRIARAAAELGITTVAVYAEEDAQSLHRSSTDEAVLLEGRGAKAYLDIDQLVATAQQNHCDAVHPGYGFPRRISQGRNSSWPRC